MVSEEFGERAAQCSFFLALLGRMAWLVLQAAAKGCCARDSGREQLC